MGLRSFLLAPESSRHSDLAYLFQSAAVQVDHAQRCYPRAELDLRTLLGPRLVRHHGELSDGRKLQPDPLLGLRRQTQPYLPVS